MLGMAILYKKCPKCGSKNSVKIVYGMPNYELFKQAEAGEIKLGGCIITDGNLEYFCKDCEHEWNREEATNVAYSKIKTIKATVGGYSGGYNDVTIDLINCRTRWNSSINIEDLKEKSIDKFEVDAFVEGLKTINFLNWKGKYIEADVCDGTQWNIKIETEDRKICKHGDNMFPEEWDSFCSSIEQVTGQDFR